MKFSEEELLRIAESGLADMSCEQIKQLIQKETDKDYKQINTDFIDLCFDVLSIKQKNESSMTNIIKIKTKKITAKKVFILVAIFMVIVVTTFTVSASVFNYNIPKEISTWIDGNAKTDINLTLADTTADGYLLENSDLAKELKIQGLSPVTLPEELIKENSEIIQINNITTEKRICTTVEIEFNYSNANGLLVITQYANDFEWTGEVVTHDVLSAEMIKANGMDILIFEQKNNCTIKYKDNLTEYDIYLYTDFETAKLFAQSIK